MTLEEFRAREQAQKDWAPGWEAIDAAFSALYPGQEPDHYGTLLTARALLGGNEYLDGYSIYTSPHGHRHLVTYGMSELYAEESSLGGEYSKWGYEMTLKLPGQPAQACLWAIDLLSNLARYTFTQNRWFEPYQYIAGGGTSICRDRDSALTGLLVVPDTEVPGRDTLYGRLDFLQLVGITERELTVLRHDPAQAPILAQRLKAEDPWLLTDLNRSRDYL